MYRHVDAALIRAAVGHTEPADWPTLVGTAAGPASWRAWVHQTWQKPEFAAAVTAASPDLARQVEQLSAGHPLPDSTVRRTVLAVLRYLLRARTRATPFGLFAGVTAARIGAVATLRTGSAHHSAGRADAEHSTALVDRFEQHPVLQPHLMLLTSTLVVERDDHVVIEHRPSGKRDLGAEHVRIRLTGPVRGALDGARTPIRWSDLTAKLATDFTGAPPSAINTLLAGLVRQQVLLTSLRPAMTISDPLTGLNYHAHHLPHHERAEISEAPRPVLDLRLDWDLTLPEAVANEAAAAARGPHPARPPSCADRLDRMARPVPRPVRAACGRPRPGRRRRPRIPARLPRGHDQAGVLAAARSGRPPHQARPDCRRAGPRRGRAR